jgi:hypothetical protein
VIQFYTLATSPELTILIFSSAIALVNRSLLAFEGSLSGLPDVGSFPFLLGSCFLLIHFVQSAVKSMKLLYQTFQQLDVTRPDLFFFSLNNTLLRRQFCLSHRFDKGTLQFKCFHHKFHFDTTPLRIVSHVAFVTNRVCIDAEVHTHIFQDFWHLIDSKCQGSSVVLLQTVVFLSLTLLEIESSSQADL